MDIAIEKEISNVRVINPSRNYWFIRTYGGEMFDTFYNKGYVGLGFNNVPYEYIKACKDFGSVEFNKLRKFISDNTQYAKGEATKWARQLVAFEHLIKKDDMIIIPSKNSFELAFGIVQSDTTIVKEPGKVLINNKDFIELPEKRKMIYWETKKLKSSFQGDLRSLLSSHQAVTQANYYSQLLESSLTHMFIKEDNIYLTININQDEDINAFELNRFLNTLTYFYKELCVEYGIEDNEDLLIKIKLQSKGKMALRTAGIAAIVAIAGIITLSNNNEVDLEFGKFHVKGKSSGLLNSLTDFLNAKQERAHKAIIFKDSMDKLKVQNPTDEISHNDSTTQDSTLKPKQ